MHIQIDFNRWFGGPKFANNHFDLLCFIFFFGSFMNCLWHFHGFFSLAGLFWIRDLLATSLSSHFHRTWGGVVASLELQSAEWEWVATLVLDGKDRCCCCWSKMFNIMSNVNRSFRPQWSTQNAQAMVQDTKRTGRCRRRMSQADFITPSFEFEPWITFIRPGTALTHWFNQPVTRPLVKQVLDAVTCIMCGFAFELAGLWSSHSLTTSIFGLYAGATVIKSNLHEADLGCECCATPFSANGWGLSVTFGLDADNSVAGGDARVAKCECVSWGPCRMTGPKIDPKVVISE